MDRGPDPCRLGIQAHPDDLRPGLDRRHHLVAMHQRRDLPGPEARAGGLWQQQRRYLRPGMPFAHRLRAQDDVRHLGRNAGLRLRGRGGRDRGHRREPHRWPPGLRLAHEEAAARGCPADRHRPAPHRPRAVGARGGGLPSSPAAGHERRDDQRPRPRGGDRGSRRRGIRARALRPRRFRELGAVHRGRASFAGSGRRA